MSYQALYRVCRPQRFDEVVGQDLITQTLKNAIKLDQPAHAYLLTGPRGTGKTSVAKIFAKAVNCPDQQEGEPCNNCSICREITQGSLGDVIEIDAASNNGVEEIRDIREKANYAPTRAKYKVYIIDEVHMLSTGAFNALLKILEEPPANVVFILATTEPHKIPLTIISRTQRFDFKRISTGDIADHLTRILQSRDIDYDEDSVNLIAQVAEGGMRDALSILDQILAFSDDQLSAEIVREATGSVAQEYLLEYFDYIGKHQVEEALKFLQKLLAEGKEQGRLVEDLILMSRDLLLYKHGGDQVENLLKLAKVTDQFKQLVNELPTHQLYDTIQVMNQAKNDMRLSNHGEIYLEVATIELTSETSQPQKAFESSSHSVETGQELKELHQEILDLKEQLLEKGKKAEQTTSEGQRQTMKRKSKGGASMSASNISDVHEVLREATRPHLNKVLDMWADFLQSLEVTESAIMNNSQPVAASERGIVVTFEYDILVQRVANNPQLQETLNQLMEQVMGHPMQLVALTAEAWPQIRQDFISQMKKKQQPVGEINAEQILNEGQEEQETDESVSKAVELFGDVVEVIDESN